MIQIIPSIAIYQGKCVKVPPGDFEHPVVYGDSPIEVAQTLEDHGIKRVHLIDLDGAKQGGVVNYNALKMMTGYTDLSIDFSGGIQTDSDVRLAFESGAKFITSATIAAKERTFFAGWLVTYGRERVVLAADSKKGKIVTGGWMRETEIDLMELIGYYYERGIKYVKCTDVNRDGTLEGPAIELYKQILQEYPELCLLASGGVRSVADIDKLAEIGVYGVLFGKAYYEGKIDLKDLRQYLE
jgi:phosphoribosylformimino-5-aminoimidazole carboxamide ribotide isomerase